MRRRSPPLAASATRFRTIRARTLAVVRKINMCSRRVYGACGLCNVLNVWRMGSGSWGGREGGWLFVGARCTPAHAQCSQLFALLIWMAGWLAFCAVRFSESCSVERSARLRRYLRGARCVSVARYAYSTAYMECISAMLSHPSVGCACE